MSEQMKICSKCGIEKEQNDDNFQFRQGSNTWRGTCRKCMNSNRKSKKEKKSTAIKAKKENKTILSKPKKENKIIQTKSNYVFDESEIAIIKNLIKDYPVLENFKNNKIKLEKSNNKRTVRTINLENNLYDIIKSKSNETNLSISDIVNTLLKKAVESL